jgi:hypothetical protein
MARRASGGNVRFWEPNGSRSREPILVVGFRWAASSASSFGTIERCDRREAFHSPVILEPVGQVIEPGADDPDSLPPRSSNPARVPPQPTQCHSSNQSPASACTRRPVALSDPAKDLWWDLRAASSFLPLAGSNGSCGAKLAFRPGGGRVLDGVSVASVRDQARGYRVRMRTRRARDHAEGGIELCRDFIRSYLAGARGAVPLARPRRPRRLAAPARSSPGSRGTGGTIRAGRPRAVPT